MPWIRLLWNKGNTRLSNGWWSWIATSANVRSLFLRSRVISAAVLTVLPCRNRRMRSALFSDAICGVYRSIPQHHLLLITLYVWPCFDPFRRTCDGFLQNWWVWLQKLKSPCWHDRGFVYIRMKVNGITWEIKHYIVAHCQDRNDWL